VSETKSMGNKNIYEYHTYLFSSGYKKQPSNLLANSITDPSGVCELMDCLATVFVDEFSNFFQHFVSFCWCLVTLIIHHLQLALDWP
jgi:hypothetical protein